jgi:hypothetical protein
MPLNEKEIKRRILNFAPEDLSMGDDSAVSRISVPQGVHMIETKNKTKLAIIALLAALLLSNAVLADDFGVRR